MSTKQTWIIVLAVSMMMLPLPALAAPTMPAGDMTAIYVLPAAVHPGGVVLLSGHDFPASETFDISVILDLVATSLGTVQSSSEGQIHATLVLPDLAPGDYDVRVMDEGENPLAYTDLTILPAITLSLNPASGPPGTEVQFTAGNLTPGSLRLDYDGVPVLGPLPVGGTSYSGSFVVPNDRPDPPGSMTEVEAINLVNSHIVGTTEANFQSQAAPAPPIYGLTDIVLPTEPVLPGEPFTILGKISPAPQGPLADYNVVAMWRSGGSQIFPISVGPANIQANGQFQLQAHAPSLLGGDPQTTAQLNEIGLRLLTPEGAGGPPVYSLEASPFMEVAVWVKDKDTGEPVEGAIVDVLFDGIDTDGLPSILGTGGPDPLADIHDGDGFNQLDLEGYDHDEFWEQIQCDDKNTDDSGYLESKLHPELPIINVMMSADDWEAVYGVAVQTAALQARSAQAGAWVPPGGEGWLRYKILVNGLPACYGPADANGDPLQEVYEKTIWFKKSSGELRDEDGNALQLPYTVYLKEIPPTLCGEGILVGLNLGSHRSQATIPGDDKEWPVWGGFVSFKPVQGQVSLAGLSDLKVYFELKAEEAANIEEPKLYFDGVFMGGLMREDYTIDGERVCEPDHPDIDMARFTATIPVNEYAYWEQGRHVLKIEWKNSLDPEEKPRERYVLLDVDSLPDWFTDTMYQERNASHSATTLVLEGRLPDPGTPPLSATIPDVGPQDNAAGASSTRRESIRGSGYNTQFLEAKMNSEALNNPGPEQTAAGSKAGGNTVQLETANHSIVDTGWMPVFRSVWGLWPIASAELGCNMWFRADVQTGGALVFANNSVESHLCVYPYATINVDTYLNLSAILGVVKGEVHAVPAIGMGLPLHIQDGQKTDNWEGGPSDEYCGFTSNMCFAYRLDVWFYTRLGVCPFCKEKEGTKNLFADSNPSPCTVPSIPTNSRIATSAVPPPQHASPSVATDGFGHTQAVYVDESSGNLVSSTYDGLSWMDVNTLATNTSASSPEIAYFMPEQAVAVWSESTLSTEAEWAATTISDAVGTTHLVYATFDGTEWSNPADMDVPSGGDGSVALASCPGTDPACPFGGAVTAVWVRREALTLPDRRFLLYYSTYHDGAWSGPQEVDPDNITATDGQPDVVYSDGQPLVAWIRDADRKLDTLDDHRIATCLLDGAGSIVVPADLPDSIVELSLAVDGDGALHLAFTRAEDGGGLVDTQHNLYSAVYSGSAWSYDKLLDTYGRPIRAEGPILTLDKYDRGTVTFRGLGFGPTPQDKYLIAEGETVGMVTGAGELTQLEVSFDGTAHDPRYLTEDGATYWEAAATFDPVSNSTIAMAVQGTPVSSLVRQQLQMASLGNQVQAVADGSPVVFARTLRLPDYVVVALAPSDRYPQSGDTVTVDVQLRNDGITYEAPVTIVATWDGGPGIGTPAGEDELSFMAAGQSLTLTLDLADPPGGYDLPHELVVTINHEQHYSEPDVTDNSLSTTLGGLPAPSDVTASAKMGSPMVFLRWTEVDDVRITGYRVYRAAGEGAPVSVGSTFVPGFVDLTIELDHTYHYTVVSFTEDGIESELSNVVDVTLSHWRVHLPLLKRNSQ